MSETEHFAFLYLHEVILFVTNPWKERKKSDYIFKYWGEEGENVDSKQRQTTTLPFNKRKKQKKGNQIYNLRNNELINADMRNKVIQ